jgi:hypothetical protein
VVAVSLVSGTPLPPKIKSVIGLPKHSQDTLIDPWPQTAVSSAVNESA